VYVTHCAVRSILRFVPATVELIPTNVRWMRMRANAKYRCVSSTKGNVKKPVPGIVLLAFMKGDQTDVQTYRPISLSCAAGKKNTERVIVQQLTSYFITFILISDS